MKATIRTFESGAGDCIFLILRNDENATSYHIMIDCNVLTQEIVQFISDQLNKRLDTLLITHVDSDHINGLTALLRRADMQDLQIGDIYFNCFQPQGDNLLELPEDLKQQLDDLPLLLPPVVDENNQKCSGMDAASFISQLNKRPELKTVWRKAPILSGERIPLGASWGELYFLSPNQNAMDEWYKELKIEFARRTGVAPIDDEFEDQDMYYELMARMNAFQKKKLAPMKTAAYLINEETIKHYAAIDADENNVTSANKASLAFLWECNGKRVLFLGDSVSSIVFNSLKTYSADDLYFEAIKIAHHGSKYNTSVALNKKVNTCHYFLTGGKKGEGPSIETIAKFIEKDVCLPTNSHTLHYNHKTPGELIEHLLTEDSKKLFESKSFYLSENNEYTFEY